ncbi:MAG: SLC13 family permease [Nitriliruptorales bacterium]|nr:SLC13 family permease [Nitriliruptorales bacterium]
MTAEIAIVYGLVLLALALFAYERMRVDATAVLIMTLLMLTGILEPSEALQGFANVATVTVAAMFVLSAGLRQTGALITVGDVLTRVGRRNRWLALAVMMLLVGVTSAFINNTAAVAIFIPIVVQLARDIGVSPSRLLMPLSFASMFGGVSTLIGTSTNLLVASIAVEQGLEDFGMFEFTPLGAILFVVGFAYMFAAFEIIPARRGGEGLDLTERFDVAPYLTRVRLDEDAPCLGETVGDNVLVRNLSIDIIEVDRNGRSTPGTAGEVHLQDGDILRVRADAPEIQKLLALEGVTLYPPTDTDELDHVIETEQETLVEAVIGPDSQLGRQTVAEVNFPGRLGAQVLALRHAGELKGELSNAVLRGGDSLLLKIDRERLNEIQETEDFIVVSEVFVPRLRRDKMPWAIAIIAGVVAFAALGIVPIVVSAIAGCLAMVMVGALTAEEVYESVNWKVIFLLAGVLPLGAAMEQTGAARVLADFIVEHTSVLGPAAVLGGFFLLTQLITSVMSNNAAAVLFAPIAIGAATSLGVDPRPFLIAVTIAASMSFITPIGYQTNTMIYGPGHFRFTDFTKIGGLLSLLVLVVSTVAIPMIWPFQ